MNINYDILYNELLDTSRIDTDTNIYSHVDILTDLYTFDKSYQVVYISNNINYSFYETLYFLLHNDISYLYISNIENYIINFKTIIINNCIIPSIENISTFFNINIIIINATDIEINKNYNTSNNFILLYKIDNLYQPIININKLRKKFNINDSMIIDILNIKNITYNLNEPINEIANYNVLNNITADVKNKICYAFLNNKKKDELINILGNYNKDIKKLKKKVLIDLILQ